MSCTRTYVVDTSVLLAAGARALRVFESHALVLPLVVVTELEGKRNDPEVGWLARQVLRALEELRLDAIAAGHTLTSPTPVNGHGGTVRIELNHVDQSGLPDAIRRESSHDVRVLAVAHGLAREGHDVALVSRDLPMRLLASVAGVSAQDYRNDQAPEDGYTGIAHATLAQEQLDALYAGDEIHVEGLDAPINTGVVVNGTSGGGALATVERSYGGVSTVTLLKPVSDAFGLKPHSAEQRIALRHLMNPATGIVSLGGKAGTGKSVLALAAGLEQVVERREFEKIIVFRPMYSVGGQDLGYLPGTVDEKMDPWAAAVVDALGSICGKNVLDEVLSREQIEMLPLTHIRGRSLHNAWVIVDEAQSLERSVLLSALSRLGQNSKVVLTHDVAQRDNLRVGRHDGVAAVIEKLKGERLFAHVTLTRSERSTIAELVTRLLDGGE